jgi:hypothetical protein
MAMIATLTITPYCGCLDGKCPILGAAKGIGGLVTGSPLKQASHATRSAAHWDGDNIAQLPAFQGSENRNGAKTLVHIQPADTDAQGFEPIQEPTDDFDGLFTGLDEAQSDHIASLIMYDGNGSIAMKVSGARFRFAAYQFLFILMGLPMIRDQGDVQGHAVTPFAFEKAARQLLTENGVQLTLQPLAFW